MWNIFGRTDKSWVVFLSTFPPRECGIATFTQDLAHALDQMYSPREEARIVALDLDEESARKGGPKQKKPDGTLQGYSEEVLEHFAQTKKESYRLVASKLNKNRHVKLVCIQHEFGIFGGEHGEYLLDFLDALQKPACVTFHTVLPQPNDHMKSLVQKISQKSAFVVVMTELSKELITGVYGIQADKVRLIPHGIHPIPYTESKEAKETIGDGFASKLAGRFVLSSFGLLGRGKGIEHAIEAMPEIVRANPDALYLILGATHPVVVRNEGESYRNSLVDRIKVLGLENNVMFVNKYLKTEELLAFLQASDIYLALSQDPNQAVSGTLSYALGVGRPVVATDFPHAKEIVTDEAGRLVPLSLLANGKTDEFRSQLAATIISMMQDKDRLKQHAEAAYFRTRKMTWPNVALSYMREFISVVPEFREKESNLPAIKLKHVQNLTDDFGMFQFANRSKRDVQHGYTTDDNARALISMIKAHRTNSESFVSSSDYRAETARLANIYLNFLEHVSGATSGFYNYVNADKSFHIERNSKENLSDANARAYYALALTAAADHMPKDFRERAGRLFLRKFDVNKKIASPRAAAFTILAIDRWIESGIDEIMPAQPQEQPADTSVVRTAEPAIVSPGHEHLLQKTRELADYIVDRFDSSKAEGWIWFEDIMTYSNGVLPESLLVASRLLKEKDVAASEKYMQIAITTLDFLIGCSFENEMCVPVGQSGWYRRGGKKGVYDQQPEEVATLVAVLAEAYRTTREDKYSDLMRQAFEWFLGNNRIGQMVYDESTGGSYDGIGQTHINLNQGAESTVMYLLARLAMEEGR